MARWLVTCPHCGSDFTHTTIFVSDAVRRMENVHDVFASLPKPELPEGGSPVECPHCKELSNFRAQDLRDLAE